MRTLCLLAACALAACGPTTVTDTTSHYVLPPELADCRFYKAGQVTLVRCPGSAVGSVRTETRTTMCGKTPCTQVDYHRAATVEELE